MFDMNIAFGPLIVIFALTLLKSILKGVRRNARQHRNRTKIRPYITTVRVTDGDTVRDSQGNRIRLHGIDAPEASQPQGAPATKFLRYLVKGEQLRVEPIEYDKHGRIVATLTRTSDNLCLNHAMVYYGFALADKTYSSRYVAAQKHAKREKAGLWLHGKIADPAAFRRANTH